MEIWKGRKRKKTITEHHFFLLLVLFLFFIFLVFSVFHLHFSICIIQLNLILNGPRQRGYMRSIKNLID